MMNKDLHFYFIRHGQTEWNLKELLQGCCDSPLTVKGIDDAKKTGKALAAIPFVAGYSSTLKRAMDTLYYIVGGRDIPCFHCEGLSEINFGQWEKKAIQSLQKNDEYQKFLYSPLEYQAISSQGETYFELYNRSVQTVDHIISQYDQGNILVIAHGIVLRLLIHVLQGGALKDHRDNTKNQRIENTAISHLHYQQSEGNNGYFTAVKLNSVEHLLS